LLWGMGVVDVLLLLVWRWGWGRYDLYFLVVLVCVVRWMRSGGMDVWWRGLLICVRDNPRVVGWLRPCHPISGGLRLWAVSGLVGAVFAVKQAVKSARWMCTSRPRPRVPFLRPWGDIPGGEGPHQQGAGWRCCAPTADCGRPDQSLATESLSTCGWTKEHLWVSSETQLCADGALRIWRIFQIADTTPGGSWADP
jgi:hypothetical protein